MSRYHEALEWLYGLESRGIKLGLERMQTAAELRGHPERELTVLHIAGTSGKGSAIVPTWSSSAYTPATGRTR